MKPKLSAVLVFLCAISTVNAGPSVRISKPPVLDASILSGPPLDAAATNGQWFKRIDTGAEFFRTHEFCDDIMGGSAGLAAINGRVSSLVYDINGNIVGFALDATVYNDTQTTEFPWGGNNSHGESLTTPPPEQYVGTLYNTVLTIEFAVADLTLLPPIWRAPYRDAAPYIVADNEDLRAWYCWNPEDPNGEHNPKGSYYVPAYYFGDIQPGGFVTRKLQFSIPGGLPPTDPRYAVLVASYNNPDVDILANRSTSLKISTWIDDPGLDTGSHPEPPLRSSNASAFHDVQITPQEEFDWADAPDPTYPTLSINNGARHKIVPGVYLGNLIDAETDGAPDVGALGDDQAYLDDEDGVTFPGPLYIGQSATVDVVCSVSGYLWAWLDFDRDGNWTQSYDRIFPGAFVTAGVNRLVFSIPATARSGQTFARFRFTTDGMTALSYDGLANDGEVEDYLVTLLEVVPETLDFGDAWDPGVGGAGYPTLLANNGARHVIVPGRYLGARVDAELDGQPTPNADGDDNNPPWGLDDEDGVLLPPVLVGGSTVLVTVVASAPGFLNAWIDWNANASWADPGEHVFVNRPLTPGTNLFSIVVPLPPQLRPGGPHTRWRYTSYASPAPSFVGPESDGEVEDHEVRLDVYDMGDAPAPYPTTLAQDGARHRLPSGYWLGTYVDPDPDGRPGPLADADDRDNLDDEDGLVGGTTLVRGQFAAWEIVASTSGYLNAWVDFNQDGDWADPGEQVALDTPLVAGTNAVAFHVPAGAAIGWTFARLRFSSMAGLSYTGLAFNGEVEDYRVAIYQAGPSGDIVITNLVPSAGGVVIRWIAETNIVYETQATTNRLSENPDWVPFGKWVTGPNNEQTDTNTANELKFYRVVAPFGSSP